jgi:hypothetical protein
MASAKALVDAYLRAEASVGREDVSFEVLAEDHAGVEKALARLGAGAPAYLAPLKAELEKISARQAALLGESRKLEEALDQLKQDMPPYPEIVRVIALARDSKEAALQRRALALEPTVLALAASFSQLTAAAQQVRDLEMIKALGADIRLPSVEACSLDPRVSHARQTLEATHASLKVKAGQLQVLFAEVEKRIGRDGDFPDILRPFADVRTVGRALSCDVLQQPLPKRSRKEPSGAYDQLLGVEEFYTYLSAFPEPVEPAMVSDLPFVSALSQSREALQKIETFLAFVRQPDNQWLLGSKMLGQVRRLETILGRRDNLVKIMVTKAESDAGRAGLVAGGIVARLATQPGQATLKGAKPEEWVAAELKRLRATLIKLNDEYSLAPPARQIEIRSQILASGLPGDPIVRRMWAFRDAAGTGP